MELQDSVKNFIKETIENVLQTQMAMVEKKLIKIIEDSNKENKNWREDMIDIFENFLEKIIKFEGRLEQIETDKSCLEKQVKEIQTQMANIKNNLDFKEEQMDILQFRQMRNALRIRGFSEGKNENLFDIFSKAVAKMMDAQPADILLQIEKIYRVNSLIAVQKQLPRDVVIYFTNRRLRDGILQISYRNKIQIKDQKVLVFKEIPYKILKKRKEFQFLVTELRDRQILYKWEIPVGLSLTYQGEKYCLDTLQKANDFYNKELKIETQPLPEIKKTAMEFNIIKGNTEQKKTQEKVFEKNTQEELQQQLNQIIKDLEQKQQLPKDFKRKEAGGAMKKTRGFFVKT